jgi:hypothetical protein
MHFENYVLEKLVRNKIYLILSMNVDEDYWTNCRVLSQLDLQFTIQLSLTQENGETFSFMWCTRSTVYDSLLCVTIMSIRIQQTCRLVFVEFKVAVVRNTHLQDACMMHRSHLQFPAFATDIIILI